MHETIGLLGGTFNPIHYGHLLMAEAALRELKLDRIILMPDGDPPHKNEDIAPKEDRLRMVKLAADGRFEVSAMEVDRPGKTYTVDTLEALHALHPDATFYVIIGADTLHEISRWRDAARVFTLCQFAAFAREGSPLVDIPGAEVVRLTSPIPEISATDIRQRVHRGYALEGLTPPVVADYIGACRLYDPPVQMSPKAIRKRLKDDLPSSRYRHVIGVADTIVALAKQHGYPEKRARLAGLLHDCAKAMSLDQMRATVDTYGVHVDPLRRQTRELLHAPASAAMARAVYGVTDPEILRAIWYHNTTRIGMSQLDKLLCLADMIEPSRKPQPWLPNLRLLAMQDLDAALLEMLRRKLAFIQLRGKDAHPDTAASLAAIDKEGAI